MQQNAIERSSQASLEQWSLTVQYWLSLQRFVASLACWHMPLALHKSSVQGLLSLHWLSCVH